MSRRKVVETEKKRKPHRFKKGESGNPAKIFQKGNKAAVGHGRPPKLPNLDEVLAKILGEVKGGRTELERILDRMKASAKLGNVKAAALVLNRGYGLPKQHIEVNDISRKTTAEIFPVAKPK